MTAATPTEPNCCHFDRDKLLDVIESGCDGSEQGQQWVASCPHFRSALGLEIEKPLAQSVWCGQRGFRGGQALSDSFFVVDPDYRGYLLCSPTHAGDVTPIAPKGPPQDTIELYYAHVKDEHRGKGVLTALLSDPRLVGKTIWLEAIDNEMHDTRGIWETLGFTSIVACHGEPNSVLMSTDGAACVDERRRGDNDEPFGWPESASFTAPVALFVPPSSP